MYSCDFPRENNFDDSSIDGLKRNQIAEGMKPHSEFSKKPQTWPFMLIRSMICQCKPSTGLTLADIV